MVLNPSISKRFVSDGMNSVLIETLRAFELNVASSYTNREMAFLIVSQAKNLILSFTRCVSGDG